MCRMNSKFILCETLKLSSHLYGPVHKINYCTPNQARINQYHAGKKYILFRLIFRDAPKIVGT